MMKNSSTYAATKGIIPVKIIPTIGFRNNGTEGMARAIVLASVGNVIDLVLYPKNAPKKTNGMEMQHHKAATIVTSSNVALEQRRIHNKTLKNRKVPKAIPGKNEPVIIVHNCHSRPWNVLYKRLLT